MSMTDSGPRDLDTQVASQQLGSGRSRPVGALARGLPDHWYPVLRSSDLRDVPRRVKRFGENLAVWRDSRGRPNIFQDRCPHRGASLSLGRVQGETLSCRYHGWTYGRSGACVHVTLGEQLGDRLNGLKERACLKSYPAEDCAGYIWAFYGERAKATPLSIPYELEDSRWSVFRQEYVWHTNWINILDNILDPLHALFLHVGVATQLRRAKLTRFEVEEDFEEGFRLAKLGELPNGQMGNETSAEFLLPALFRLDLADGTPRGVMRVVMFATPIDEQSTFLCYIQGRRVSGLARLWWHVVWWLRFRRAQDMIKAQDREMLETLGPIEDARERENLTLSDIGVIHLRRRLNRAFAESRSPNAGRQMGRVVSKRGNLHAAWEADP